MELIVVIAILVMLSSLTFVKLTQWLGKSRDAARLTDLATVSKALELYYVEEGEYPKPDRYVEVKYSGETLTYQGKFGEGVVRELKNMSKVPKDPKDKKEYTYVVDEDQDKYELLAMVEGRIEVGMMDRVYAVSGYKKRIPKVKGDKVGVILKKEDNTPLEELVSGERELSGDTNEYKLIVSKKDVYEGTGLVIGNRLYKINKYPGSCLDILKYGKNEGDGIYEIDIDGLGDEKPFKVYCNMTIDGGGWTLVHKTTDNPDDLGGTLTTTEGNPDWDGNEEYRLSINYWKQFSTQKAMAINIDTAGHKRYDIEDGVIQYIGTDKVIFSKPDTFKIFNAGTDGYGESTCTSGTPYWNEHCCSRCVNYDASSYYGSPDNAPMIYYRSTSASFPATGDNAGGTYDAQIYRLKKMGIFLK